MRKKLLTTLCLTIAFATGAFAQKVDPGAIVGGSNADIADYPYQVSVQTTSGSHFCGGTIINEYWIVSAAHCFQGSTTGTASNIQILAGSTRLSTASQGQIRQVETIITFPGYEDVTLGRDCALLKLSSPLDLSAPNVGAIPMATEADRLGGLTDPGIISFISGWGTLSSGGTSPDVLQAAQVPIVSNADADAAYSTVNITDDQLAAGYLGEGGVDACQGDSGGPLVVPNASNDGVILAGIVSWGNGCALPDYPGMYARASSFETWVDGIVNNTGYCYVQGNTTSDEWVQSVSIGSFTNNSGDNLGYGDFTGQQADLEIGTSYSLTLEPGYSGRSYNEYWRIWIDLNNDQDFDDAGELVFDAGSAAKGITTGSLTVPAGTTPVLTRMRVAMKYNAAPGPCEVFQYGEVEDYTVNLTDGGNNGGGDPVYCVSSGGGNKDYINSVSFAGNSNTSGADGGYGDYTNVTFNVSAGSAYTLSVAEGHKGRAPSQVYRAWVDWNQDGDFDDSGELVLSAGPTTAVSVSGSVVVPSTAFNGNTRMRISQKNNSAPGSCETYGSGEVEDYSISVSNGATKSTDFTSRSSANELSLSYFPNPARDNLTLTLDHGKESTGISVRILTLSGAEVFSQKMSSGNGITNHSLNISGLRDGIYMLKVKGDGYNEVEKLVIKR
ncbi:trypsin-like serine protease [Roseivirga sp. BDSF3-8]|uniref:trypsin-like serine protease n=1 Tax=Roseivirga sp. BDSF3-8 TaxID=3241598 RepID=UPI003532204A